MPSAQPISISNRSAAGILQIEWDDGVQQTLTHQLLRRSCRCADCRMLRLRSQAEPEVAEQLRLEEVLMVGQYGIQLVFNDGHRRGIYPWELLRELLPAALAAD